MSEQESPNSEEAPPGEDLTTHDVEKLEEAKLKAKYPSAAGIPGRPGGPGGHSAFLQKRLAKGQKYFDSGDYQMAKQKMGGGVSKQPLKIPVQSTFGTGDAIPTPDSVPARKTSIIQSSKLTHNAS